MKQIALCIICLGLGWFGGVYFSSHEHDEAHASESDRLEIEISKAAKRDELILDLKEQLSDQEALTDMLNKELSETRESLAAKLAPEDELEEVEAGNPFMSNMQVMAVEMMDVQNQEELEKLKRSLNLTADQLEALEDFYKKESEQQSRIMQQVFSGKPMEEIQDDLMGEIDERPYFTVSDLMEDILSPEQLAIYEENEEKEALEQKEAMAYSQLSQIQRQFVLEEEQKDAVFAIFYEAEYELEPDDWESLEIDSQDPDFSVKYQEAQNERLLEALSDVLTEEQLDRHRKKLESELEMQRKAMSMFGEGLFVTPTEE